MVDDEVNEEDDIEAAIAQFAEELLKDNNFIYKGMENLDKVSKHCWLPLAQSRAFFALASRS